VVAILQSEIQMLDGDSGETLTTSRTISLGVERFGTTSRGRNTEFGEGNGVERVSNGTRTKNECLVGFSKTDCGTVRMHSLKQNKLNLRNRWKMQIAGYVPVSKRE
jgi:hypothetical protein